MCEFGGCFHAYSAPRSLPFMFKKIINMIRNSFFLVVVMLLATVDAFGINTWLGNTSDWGTPSNWSNGVVPNGCTADVLIPYTGNDPVVISSVSVRDIEIQDNTLLLLIGSMDVCGNVTGGTSSNALVLGSGALVLSGSSSQSVSGMIELRTLRINNTAGVVMQPGSAVNIYSELQLQAGNFVTTGGVLTFKSTYAAQAAIIDNFSPGYAGTITGPVTAERYYDAAASGAYNQHFLGSPVGNVPFSQLGASGTPGYIVPVATCDETQVAPGSPFGTVFSYDEVQGAICSTAGWKVEVAGNTQHAQGYSIYKTGSGVIALTGQPNLASSYALNNLDNSNWLNVTLQGHPVASGWHLVANPYLAELDISAAVSGFDVLKMVWNTNGPFAGSYQPATVVAPFQGFMVHRSAQGAASYVINATQRVKGNSPDYQKQTNEQLVITAANNTTGLLDVTTVAFNTNATVDYDNDFDGLKMAGAFNRHTLFSYTSDTAQWYCLNTLPPATQPTRVPVGFEPGVTGNYTLSFEGLASFDVTSYIMLEDTKLHVMHNIRQGDYSFSSAVTDSRYRFVLHFTPAIQLNTLNAGCETYGAIELAQQGPASWVVSVNDIQGNNIGNGALSAVSPFQLSVPTGVYQITLVDTSGYTVVKNVQVNGVQTIAAAMTADKNTVETAEDVTFASATANATTIEWNFGDGATAATATATHQYQSEGIYTVSLTVTNADGCSSTVQQQITVTAKSSTGIDNLDKEAIRMWSNESNIFIDFSKVKQVKARIDVYNILGQKVTEDTWTKAGIYTKTLSQVDAVYILVHVNNNGKITTQKLFITGTK